MAPCGDFGLEPKGFCVAIRFQAAATILCPVRITFKVDRRSVLAFFFIFLVLLFYPNYLEWITPKTNLPRQNETAQVGASPEAPVDAPVEANEPLPPPTESAQAVSTMEVKTEKLLAVFTNVGAGIKKLSVVARRNGASEEIVLFDVSEGEVSAFALSMPDMGFDLEKAVFDGPHLFQDGRAVAFSYTLPNQLVVRKQFILSEIEPVINAVIEVSNPAGAAQPFLFEVSHVLHTTWKDNPKAHKDQFESQTLASYSKFAGEVGRASFSKLKKKGELQEGQIDWAGLGRRYFAVLVKREGGFFDQYRAFAEEDVLHASLRVPVEIIAPGHSAGYHFLIYAGPTARQMLKSYNAGFELILAPPGFWGFFKTIILVMLGFFYGLLKNYGLAIIAVSAATKLAFWPLTHISFSSMQKMQEITPKVKAIQDQHQGNQEKLNKEMMELYKRHKVNPVMGCLPMFLQIPVFIALYQVLMEAVELRGAHFFGWITDLSEQDVLFRLPFSLPLLGDAVSLLPLLMIASTVVQQNLQPQATSGNPEQQKIMKFFPVLLGFMFYKLPSGLVLYWTVSNVLAILHQLIIRKKPALETD